MLIDSAKFIKTTTHGFAQQHNNTNENIYRQKYIATENFKNTKKNVLIEKTTYKMNVWSLYVVCFICFCLLTFDMYWKKVE